jgi:GPH family glycoside/pentoside/hexuronide:cation symporter
MSGDSERFRMGGDTPLSTWTRAGFGSGQIAGQIFRDTPSLLLLFFLTTVVGIPPAIAGGAIFLPKVFWGVLADLGVGLVSDRVAHRFPRRRWLLVGAVTAPLAMVLIFHIPDASTTLRTTYIFAVFCFYMLTFASFSVPYLSQFSQITRDSQERTALLAWRHTFTGVGLLVGSSLTPALIGVLGGGRSAYQWASLALAAVCAASLLTAYAATPKAAAATPTRAAFNIAAFTRVFKYKPFATLACVEFIQMTGAGLSYASIAYFLTYDMNRSDALVQLGGVSFVMAVVVIFGPPLWVMAANAFGKKRAYLLAVFLHAAVQLSWGLCSADPLPLIYVFAGLIGFFNAGWGIMSLTMLADMIARSAHETGENQAGSFSAVWALIEKVGIALGGTLIAGFVLSAFGFRPASAGHPQVQTRQALTGIAIVFAYAPALFNLTAAFVFWKWGRSPKDHNKTALLQQPDLRVATQ